jgi:MOSC domain-containing protein YiiM
MKDPRFPKRFQAEGRMGAYLRIIREGDVGTGDAIAIVARPEHGVTLADMVAALHDRTKADALARVPALPAFWQRIASGRSSS